MVRRAPSILAGLLGLCAMAVPAALAQDKAAAPAFVPVEEDGSWPMPGKNLASTRFSGLDQINAATVRDLQVAFTFSTGVLRGQEAAPVYADGTLYIVSPFPNVVYALDMTQPGAPLKWQYDPKPSASAQGVACCDTVNRGVALADGRVVFNTLDGQTIALDAATGKELWRTRLADINKGETITMAPLVVKGKVLVGNSGGEFGVRGWLTALDLASGRMAWRAYSTGPDADVLIGPDFKPFYELDRGQDLGITTWPPEAWRTGGGTVWGWLSYDPELDLLYYGTANPGPWNAEQRPGDNKWTAGVFARTPDNGQAKWFYQYSPHDLSDYDGVNEHVLIDLPWQGRTRKAMIHPDRNGYLYLLDRTTGEVLAADPFVHVNSSTGVDLKTGRIAYNPEKHPTLGKVIRDVCPTAPGAKDWQPSSFSPATGLLYIPHQNLCMDWEAVEVNYIAGTPYVGANVRMKAGPGGNRGFVTAWDPVNRKPAWQIREDFPVWSGTLATAGGLVFYGTLDGWFKAVDAASGDLLWQFKTGSGIIGQPTSFRGPDGRQYVAILSGVGGWAGAVVSGGLDPRDVTAAKGFAHAVADLKDKTTKGGTLYVFALPPH